MEIVKQLRPGEYFRQIAMSRGAVVLPDSNTGEFKVKVIGQIYSDHHKTKEEALRSFFENEPDVDFDFVNNHESFMSMKEGEPLTLDGVDHVLVEVFSRSGLVESKNTEIKVAELSGRTKIMRAEQIASSVVDLDSAKQSDPILDEMLNRKTSNSSQISFNF